MPSKVVVDANGQHVVEMTPAEVAALAVLQQEAQAAMTVFTDEVRIGGRVRTIDATPTEILRLPLLSMTGYTGQATLIGVDTGNGAVRVIRASFAVKRLGAGALAVGAPVVVASHADALATAWQVSATVAGTDALVMVTGAAGRTIDWSLSGTMTAFTPAGR